MKPPYKHLHNHNVYYINSASHYLAAVKSINKHILNSEVLKDQGKILRQDGQFPKINPTSHCLPNILKHDSCCHHKLILPNCFTVSDCCWFCANTYIISSDKAMGIGMSRLTKYKILTIILHNPKKRLNIKIGHIQ